MRKAINWFGIAGAASIFLLIVVSLYTPWWNVVVGSVDKPLAQFNASPLSMNVTFLGQAFTFPLILAINLSVIVSLLAGGIAILIYSINPTKPYAKRLLSFSYRKPLYALIIFVIGLIVTNSLVKYFAGFDVPLIGAVNAATNGSIFQSLPGGVSITSVLFTSGFQWPFYLAMTSAGLCIAARLYNKKVALTPTITGTPAQFSQNVLLACPFASIGES